jgi:hypothetical protein
MKTTHVFRVFVHIDVVEDLLFYHFPREELIADGKVPWREFTWHYGRPDGEQRDLALQPGSVILGLNHIDGLGMMMRIGMGALSGIEVVESCIEWLTGWTTVVGSRVGQQTVITVVGIEGESSHGRNQWHRDLSPAPSHGCSPFEERRALRELWRSKQ